MARSILHVGYKAGKRSHGWRTSASTAPVQTWVATAQARDEFPFQGLRVKRGFAKCTLCASQVQLITVYAIQNGFDVPVMSGWSAANADDFYTQMETMVANDVFTYE
jgi:hypothetical protein